jgi:omega-6 fatty acid desaturase (delta-12 desaturase)
MVLLFPVYSIVMGTVMLGPWVLGHECGHGAFAPHKPCVKIAGKSLDMNDAVGFVLHSALLVPFWSWQYSHNKHHKYTNHLVLGETHVPNLEGDPVIGDTFPLLRIIGMHMGFPAYLLGFSRAKTQADLKTPMDRSKWADHFHSGTPIRLVTLVALTLPVARRVLPSSVRGGCAGSQTMPDDWRIEMSTVGCIIHLLILAANEAPDEAGWKFWYFGPYLIVNAWLVLYTWLHHTHPDVPHYGSDTFSFVRGALATIDRPYPWIIDHLHHHIGSTHVAHHLCSDVPHYRAVELREVLRPILGPYYLFDPQPMYSAVWQVATECHHVEGNAGVQYYRHKEHRSEAFRAKEAANKDSAKTK